MYIAAKQKSLQTDEKTDGRTYGIRKVSLGVVKQIESKNMFCLFTNFRFY